MTGHVLVRDVIAIRGNRRNVSTAKRYDTTQLQSILLTNLRLAVFQRDSKRKETIFNTNSKMILHSKIMSFD